MRRWRVLLYCPYEEFLVECEGVLWRRKEESGEGVSEEIQNRCSMFGRVQVREMVKLL